MIPLSVNRVNLAVLSFAYSFFNIECMYLFPKNVLHVNFILFTVSAVSSFRAPVDPCKLQTKPAASCSLEIVISIGTPVVSRCIFIV